MDENMIVIDPQIMTGKPVVKGTRITVEHILEELSQGRTIDDLVAAHPRLSKQMVLAALDYAAKVLKSDVIHISIA